MINNVYINYNMNNIDNMDNTKIIHSIKSLLEHNQEDINNNTKISNNNISKIKDINIVLEDQEKKLMDLLEYIQQYEMSMVSLSELPTNDVQINIEDVVEDLRNIRLKLSEIIRKK